MDEGDSASAAAGIDGSPILSDLGGEIYMYWMAHYRILVIKLFSPSRRGKWNIFGSRVRCPAGLSPFKQR